MRALVTTIAVFFALMTVAFIGADFPRGSILIVLALASISAGVREFCE